MLQAIAEDFSAIGYQVVALQDDRLQLADCLPLGTQLVSISRSSDQRDSFRLACESTSAAMVVAPEFNNFLIQRTQWGETHSPCLLSPASNLVSLGTSKWDTIQHWRAAGLPVVETHKACEIATWKHLRDRPVVTKPNDGAGSEEIFSWKMGKLVPSSILQNDTVLIQPLIVGTPVSVSAIGDSRDFVLLPAAQQQLDNDFKYLGGKLPLAEPLAARAHRLARQAITSLGPFRGWIGVDIILGSCDRGNEDFLVELNPRLTSSYIGLRRLMKSNLASWIVGGDVGQIGLFEQRTECVEFKFEP